MTSDFNVRLASLQNSYETLKNEIGELKKIIINLSRSLDGNIVALSSRINNNNDLHVSNFNKSISYLDDTSEKIKNDIKAFEKVQDNMSNIYVETLGNRVSLDKTTDKIKELENSLNDKENKLQQQQKQLLFHISVFSDIDTNIINLRSELSKTKDLHQLSLNKNQDNLRDLQLAFKLILETLPIDNERINSIVSSIERINSTIQKYYFTHYADLNTLEKKLTEYIDKKIVSLPKPPSKFETSPQVMEELKILGLNIKNLVLQKNTLEIDSKKHEQKLDNLTQQIQSLQK